MSDYTIIGEYYPEDNKIIRIGDEGKEIVGDGFVAFCIITRKKPKEYFPQLKSIKQENELFKKFLQDKDFVHFLGEKRVKQIKKSFWKFKIYARIKNLTK